jgi:AbiTii-like protein
MSLLRDIQNDLAGQSGDVTAVLRKCKILSARLGSREFADWVGWELGGYPEGQPTPEYRRLAITYYANFSNSAWQISATPIPLQVVPEQYRDSFQAIEFREGIAKAISLTEEGASIPWPELIFAIQGKMYPTMNCHAVTGRIGAVEFVQLVSAVKSRILDFVLEIEAANPDAGEAAPNSHPVPQDKLQPIVNNFLGSVGSVAQQSHGFRQTSTITIQAQDLTTLVSELTAHLHELHLGPSQRKLAEAQIATLKAQQLADEPDAVIVQQAGRSLRNITEGAVGSLLAAAAQPGVWHTIHRLLATFS